MIANIFKNIKWYFAWKKFCMRYMVKYPDAIFVLPCKYEKINHYVLMHLEDYIKRKSASRAIIISDNEKIIDSMKQFEYSCPVIKCIVKSEYIEKLYLFYSFYKFYDNIVFTYTDKPKDNLMEYLLETTIIDEEEVVCLGLFQLRNMQK